MGGFGCNLSQENTKENKPAKEMKPAAQPSTALQKSTSVLGKTSQPVRKPPNTSRLYRNVFHNTSTGTVSSSISSRDVSYDATTSEWELYIDTGDLFSNVPDNGASGWFTPGTPSITYHADNMHTSSSEQESSPSSFNSTISNEGDSIGSPSGVQHQQCNDNDSGSSGGSSSWFSNSNPSHADNPDSWYTPTSSYASTVSESNSTNSTTITSDYDYSSSSSNHSSTTTWYADTTSSDYGGSDGGFSDSGGSGGDSGGSDD